MKRVTPEEKIRLGYLAQQRFRRRLRRRGARVLRRLEAAEIRAIQLAFEDRYDVILPKATGRYPIMLPKVFSLRDNFDGTVATITMMRDAVLKARTPILLCFDKVEALEPAATLLLVAEIFRCRTLRKWRGGEIVSGNYPQNVRVFRQLRQMGFYRLLSIDERLSIPDGPADTKSPFFIRFRTMNSVHPQLAASFCALVVENAFAMKELTQNRMVAALKEAMGNAHEHAYKKKSEYQYLSKRWWLAGHISPSANEMMVMILDQGVGIPNTLEPNVREQLWAILKLADKPSDGVLIAAATELHRTSTGRGGRGKGFQDMKRFVDSCDDGELRVWSNRGSYTYLKGEARTLDQAHSIGGTLIEWRVRHGKVMEVNDG